MFCILKLQWIHHIRLLRIKFAPTKGILIHKYVRNSAYESHYPRFSLPHSLIAGHSHSDRGTFVIRNGNKENQFPRNGYRLRGENYTYTFSSAVLAKGSIVKWNWNTFNTSLLFMFLYITYYILVRQIR